MINLIESGAKITASNLSGTHYGEVVSETQILGSYLIRIHSDDGNTKLYAIPHDQVCLYVDPNNAVNELTEV